MCKIISLFLTVLTGLSIVQAGFLGSSPLSYSAGFEETIPFAAPPSHQFDESFDAPWPVAEVNSQPYSVGYDATFAAPPPVVKYHRSNNPFTTYGSVASSITKFAHHAPAAAAIPSFYSSPHHSAAAIPSFYSSPHHSAAALPTFYSSPHHLAAAAPSLYSRPHHSALAVPSFYNSPLPYSQPAAVGFSGYSSPNTVVKYGTPVTTTTTTYTTSAASAGAIATPFNVRNGW